MKKENRNFKRLMTFAIAATMCMTGLAFLPTASATPTTFDFGDVTLTSNGVTDSGHFTPVFDLTACDMTISFTYDANGLVDDAGCHAWAELGIRQVSYGDFNPTWLVEGAGVWLATDYDWTVDTFDPDPFGAPIQDLDDKLILQKAGGHGEGDYNLPSTPPNPWANHRVWWDRDGVDPWQNDETANTGGIYNIIIALHATSATTGTAYMNIRGLDQGFETDGNWNTIELTPGGMTFTGDMTQMQVFYGLYGYGATHSMAFNNIVITGCTACVSEVWVDDDWAGSTSGDIVDGHTFGYDAFAVIQDGIDAVCDGGTVTVSDGTYNENIVINKPITLEAGSSPIIDGTGIGGVGININCGHVTVDNFEIRNFDDGIHAYVGSDYSTDWTNIHITNNVIHDCGPGVPHGFGIYIGTEGERFHSSSGWYDPSLTDFLDFTGLQIIGNEVYNTAQAALVLQSIKSTSGTLDVTGNNVHDTTYSSIWIDSASDIKIEDNNLHDCGYGVFISSYSDGYYEGTPNQQFDSRDIEIINNDILTNGNGVSLYDGWPSLININFNQIVGNTGYGVYNYLAEDVNAEKNYWGHATGADHSSNPHGTGQGGDAASNYVDFIPWYATSTITPSTEYVTVTDNPIIALSDTIQDGIDAVCDGGTVTVCDGTYDGFTVDGRNAITIQAGSSPVVNTVVTNTGLSHPHGTTYDSIIAVLNSNNIIVDGFEVDGTGITFPCNAGGGILYYESSGTIKNNYVHDINKITYTGSGAGPTCFNAMGIYVHADSGTNYTVDSEGNTVQYFGKFGILYDGVNVNGDIYDNTVEGYVPNNYWLNNGIEVAAGAYAEISFNEVFNCKPLNGMTWSSVGILIIDNTRGGAIADIHGNVVHDNYVNIWVQEYDSTVIDVVADVVDNEVYNGDYCGVLVWGLAGVALDVEIIGNEIHDNMWGGVMLFDSESVLIDGNIIYNEDAGVYLDPSSNNIISDNDIYYNNYGIYITTYGSPPSDNNQIICNNIHDNDYGVYLDDTTNTLIHCNRIYDNTDYGVYSTAPIVDALYNWWGDNSGPYNDTLNPEGTGNAVNDNVNFDPWAGQFYPDITDPIQIGSTVTMTGYFTCDMDDADINWGDDTVESETLGEVTSLSKSHEYTTPGVYTVTLQTTDDDDSWNITMAYQYVVVYDPSAGFVTGGGWIYSEAGAYVDDPDAEGKANFGFVSKYKKGQSTPTGNTEFQFKAGDLNFHSSSYEWLVITNHKAKYKGTGTINGAGNYGFMISAIDEDLTPSTDVDLFRIKIWDKDNGDAIVYDNQLGDPEDGDPTTAIGGGQIKIHQN